MAVNMNKRDCEQNIFGAFVVFFCILHVAIAATTTPATMPSTTDSNGTSSTAAVTTTPTTTTTTTTTIAPLQEPAPVDSNSLIGECPCDLTGNACDVNCCCDQDCTDDDKLTFSQCLPFSTNVDNRLCMRDEIISFENSDPIISEITDDSLFCIYYDNQKERNYYTNPDSIDTLASFEEYKKEFPSFSFQSAPASGVDFDSSFYKSGDPVYTVFESEAVGVLGLPRTMTTTKCVDDNPAGQYYT